MVSILIFLVALLISGVISGIGSSGKFLVFIVIVAPLSLILAVLCFLVRLIPQVPQHAKIALHHSIRWIIPLVMMLFAIFYPERTTIQKIPLKHGYTCIMYQQSYEDLTGADVYYEIRKGRSIVIPMTSYGYAKKAGGTYQFSVVYTHDDAIIGILDTSAFSTELHELIVIFDTHHNESWSKNVLLEPDAQRKWLRVYQQLKAEHPDLPVPDDFSIRGSHYDENSDENTSKRHW